MITRDWPTYVVKSFFRKIPPSACFRKKLPRRGGIFLKHPVYIWSGNSRQTPNSIKNPCLRHRNTLEHYGHYYHKEHPREGVIRKQNNKWDHKTSGPK